MSTDLTMKWISDLLHQLQQQNMPGFYQNMPDFYGGVKQIPEFIESFDINNDDFIHFGEAVASDLDTLRDNFSLGRTLLDVKWEVDQKIMYARASAYFRDKIAYAVDSNSRIINFPIKRQRLYLDDFHLEALCLFTNDYIKENKENLFSSVVSGALRAFLYNEDLLVFSLLREATLNNTITYKDKNLVN